MKPNYHLTIVMSCLLLVAFPACTEKVKPASVAGAFYPADPKTLSTMVDDFLAKAEYKQENGRLLALIAPHAGYQFSGQVAAYTYRQLQGMDLDTIILIGPSHFASFSGASVYAEGGLSTPLGAIRINEQLAKSLLNEQAGVTFNPAAFEKEHSLEVQLPFLQRTLKGFRLVPILIGSPTRASFEALTEKLTTILRKNSRVIIIASTDLSHYHDYATAQKMDRKVVDAAARMSVEDLEKYLTTREGEMCGGYPVLLTMAVARSLGATHGVLYQYANSGDVTGDREKVVGYAAMGLYKSALSDEERKTLLSLAKDTIISYVKRHEVPAIEIADPRLRANGAVFVTINRNGNLRGCIGNIQPILPLYQSVINNAVAACSRDPRFSPMNAEELKDMDVEVTILSPLEPLEDKRDIRIGTHGLYLVKDGYSGILLPQVATEYHWDADTFLEQVSMKAGLRKDAWKDSRLYYFTADIVR